MDGQGHKRWAKARKEISLTKSLFGIAASLTRILKKAKPVADESGFFLYPHINLSVVLLFEDSKRSGFAQSPLLQTRP
jgi:hypothetical protein